MTKQDRIMLAIQYEMLNAIGAKVFGFDKWGTEKVFIDHYIRSRERAGAFDDEQGYIPPLQERMLDRATQALGEEK